MSDGRRMSLIQDISVSRKSNEMGASRLRILQKLAGSS